ncbi:F-box and WD repeat domain containing protein 10B [Sebastes fasciatus]|uniref:F-box and WD repeat domain containing protein 10B n=1 Tax=Sebastes fasciatus TaxID=394691 RepID=UPI003D9FAAE0
MKSVKVDRSVSAGGLHGELTEGGCVYMCGMCPSCIFAPNPPASTRCLWKASDEFKRTFVVDLLVRCKSIKVLESIQSVLGVTSWSLFTYARSRRPVSPQDYPRLSDRTLLDGKPLGLDLNEICNWFNSRPDWMQSHYLCSLFSLCDSELLRMLANLTSVLLVRQKRGFLSNVSSASQRDQVRYGDSEDPAFMVVLGSSKSMSGVSRYKDFISCLPVDLSKRILGLLPENTLRRCNKVCRRWQQLTQETVAEVKFRRRFQDQIMTMMKKCKSIKMVSPTYANIVEVPIPVKDDEKVDIHPSVQKFKTFEAAYAKIETKTVQMEERNVYCGAYFTTVLLDKEDTHRVVDYRGGLFMATGSKDRTVQLLHVASETKVVSVMKGHVGSIRVVLLCEDRSLLITGSCDASIRCWCLKTDACLMTLYGHSGTVNSLDVHDDTLVSGAKDCLIKVWSLHTGKQLEDFHFKHSTPVQCVRLNTTTLYSSCDQGLVKVWDMETALLLRVIDAHKNSVRCLFVDEWHFLSGDSSGQVKAWSINCDVKECLMTFNHLKEVKSLTLVYLRLVTGCVDGKIRIFNFLTGDCLREITAETEAGQILSLHFHDNRILVNMTYSVKLFQFAKVFWDYTESTEGDQGEVVAHDGLVSEKSAASLRKFSFTSVGSDHGQKIHNCNKKHLCHVCSPPTQTKCRAQAGEDGETAKQSVMLSEKAASERVKMRGLHHPLTRDSILLKINAIQKAQCIDDEVTINMESNARLRDSWGPQTFQDDPKQSPQTQTCHTPGGHPKRPMTCVPILKRALSQNMTQPRSADTHRATKRVSGFTTSATEGPPAPEYTRSLPNLERSMKTSTSLPRISPVGPLREQGGQLDCQAKKDLMKQKPSKRNKKQETTL